MTSVAEIEQTVKQLTPEQLQEFRKWFVASDAENWDLQFERDAREGQLEGLAVEPLNDLYEGKCRDL